MTNQRPVSPFESIYFVDMGSPVSLYGTPAFFESVVRGRLDPATVRRALDLLADHHPALRAEVVAGETGPLLRVRERVRPPLIVREGLDAFDEVVNTRPDWSESLLHAWLLTEGEHSQVVLALHHGVSDARSGFALLDEFWQYCTTLATGAVPSVQRRDTLPEAIDVRLSADFPDHDIDSLVEVFAEGAEDTEPAVLPTEALGRADGPPTSHRFVIDRQEFAPGFTVAVLCAARARGITVNSLVSGILMTVVRDQMAPEPGPLPLVCGHAVDLRPRLTPELPRSVVVNCITGFQTPLIVAPDDRLETVGRAVTEQVSSALARRDPERFLLAGLRAAARGIALPVPVVSYGISNVGRVLDHPVPEGLHLVRFGATVNAVGLPPKLLVATLGGRLLIQQEYDGWTYSAAQMRRVGEALRAALEALVH
ncbi:hypothetical protein G3I40_06470 [Streptomyces sp. SID14478]|uniref:phthiocerol/phthiodiolone dimycocerosyl transferase family protein n=1 Tax=Streptomyces sp. SID14478 TaxID=2706073 RepID=UPI0013D944CE|nr:hypothetical protein [Streptomyces sp. SID14478]NEB74878.1 hypothetical protein [Streptomyces sp. SID14478]